jgi:hypothetical protein
MKAAYQADGKIIYNVAQITLASRVIMWHSSSIAARNAIIQNQPILAYFRRVTMFKKFAAFAVLSIASVSAFATAQAVTPQATLEGQTRFGAASVDLTHARMVDITPGNQKVVDANGVTRMGYFYNMNTFVNHPAFKRYIRSYSGSNVFYNASMFTEPECVNGATRLIWINGGVTDVVDGCSLRQVILNYSRTN